MVTAAERCFQKSKSNRGPIRNEFKKMFEDEVNLKQYIMLLLGYGLIPSQPKWGLASQAEQYKGSIS